MEDGKKEQVTSTSSLWSQKALNGADQAIWTATQTAGRWAARATGERGCELTAWCHAADGDGVEDGDVRAPPEPLLLCHG